MGILPSGLSLSAVYFETLVFYPQYCMDCLCSFVSRTVHSLCWSCGGVETINCYREFHPDSVENLIIESETCL